MTSALTVTDADGRPIKPSTAQGGPWLEVEKDDVQLFSRMCRCILNHAPIGEYYSRFNIDEDLGCTCGRVDLQTRKHIMLSCPDFVRQRNHPTTLWELRSFLKRNPKAFAFNRAPAGVG